MLFKDFIKFELVHELFEQSLGLLGLAHEGLKFELDPKPSPRALTEPSSYSL